MLYKKQGFLQTLAFKYTIKVIFVTVAVSPPHEHFVFYCIGIVQMSPEYWPIREHKHGFKGVMLSGPIYWSNDLQAARMKCLLYHNQPPTPLYVCTSSMTK